MNIEQMYQKLQGKLEYYLRKFDERLARTEERLDSLNRFFQSGKFKELLEAPR